MDVVEFTKSEKGRTKVVYQGFCYNFDKLSKADSEISFWLCENYYKEWNCKARIHMKDQNVVSLKGSHNHGPNGQRVLVLAARDRIKARAATTSESTEAIVSGATSHLSEAAVAQLPTEEALRRTVQNVRKTKQNFPTEPNNLIELVIPDELKFFEDGSTFLMHDSGPVNDRILVFTTRENLELLATSRLGIFRLGIFGWEFS